MKDIEIIDIDYSGNKTEYRYSDSFKENEFPTPFIIPDQTPFYTRNCVVKGNGKILTRGTDYVFEDYLDDMEMLTGKTVCATIRLLKKTLEDYTVFTIDYNAVGKPMVSYKYLMESAEKIVNNDTKVDWNTQVFGKPETYYPAKHNHDVREKQELVGFSDLVVLFKQFTGQQTKHGLDIWNRLVKIREATYADLETIYKNRWDQLFSHIGNANVPHPMTKKDIGLGNHPNFATASPKDDRDGLRGDLLSTPKGLMAALDRHDVDSDGYLRQGSLPFSYYGTGIYIPPPIGGSFEGLGTNSGGNAMCLESNGWVVALTRGFDSKVKRLYYYYNKNIYDSTSDFIFSGYYYNHEVITADGTEANIAISGSNGRVLMLGDQDSGKYYITLGNGTLDAKSHQLMKVDRSVFVDTDGTDLFDPTTAYVMLIGNWVYLVAQKNAYLPNEPTDQKSILRATYQRTAFYRIPISDLYGSPGKVVKFVRQKLNYQNSEGEWLYSQDYVNVCKTVWGSDSSGTKFIKSAVYDFIVPPDTLDNGPWKRQWFNQETDGDKSITSLKVMHVSRYTYKHEISTSGDAFWCIPYTFNTNTNTLTLDSRFFKPTIDIRTGAKTAPAGRDLNEWFHQEIGRLIAGHAELSASWITGIGFTRVGTSIYLLPYVNANYFFGYNKSKDGALSLTDWEMFNQDLKTLNGNGTYIKNIPLDSPFGFTSKCMYQRDVFDYNGGTNSLPLEVFQASDKFGNKNLFYRKSKENYNFTKRPNYNFKYINAEILARPPSSDFGPVTIGKMNQGMSARVGFCLTNSKDKYGVQYGITNIASPNYDKTGDRIYYTGGINDSVTDPTKVARYSNSGDGVHLTLLGTTVFDDVNKTVTIQPSPTDAVHLPRSEIVKILKYLLGNNFSSICTENGGQGSDGEWFLTINVGAREGGNNVQPSIASIVWHKLSDPANTHISVMTFNWSTTSTSPQGVKQLSTENYKRPSSKYGENGGANTYTGFQYTTNGNWTYNIDYGSDGLVPSCSIMFTDPNNYEFFIHNAVLISVPLDNYSTAINIKVSNGNTEIETSNISSFYSNSAYSAQKVFVTDYGLCNPVSSSDSGAAALYVKNGNVPQGSYLLLQAVFVEGNWSVMINTDMSGTFNGSERQIPKTIINLDALGIDQKNKTFYLYAVSGKTAGYYDLTLSERTASPYHVLCAVIKTNAFGIEQINVEQRFAISGFSISTVKSGGTIPASSGSVSDTGTFKTVGYADLFDESKYN